VHPTGCGNTAPTTMRARAVWLDQRLRIHSGHLLPPRGQRPATIRYRATGGACRCPHCPARQHPGCEGAAPTTERARAVWMRQQHRIHTGGLLYPPGAPPGAHPPMSGTPPVPPPPNRRRAGLSWSGAAPPTGRARADRQDPRHGIRTGGHASQRGRGCPALPVHTDSPAGAPDAAICRRSRLRGFVLRHLNYSVLYPGTFQVFAA
jgi:hypothetical protein